MPVFNVQEAMQTALRHHQAGELQQAEALYRQVLAQEPGNADALHLLGLVAFQTGHPQPAFDLITQAIRLNPRVPVFHNSLGQVCQAMGDRERAIACYRQAVALRPAYAEARYRLADALREAGQLDEAILAYREAIREMRGSDETAAPNPNLAGAYNNLGNICRARGMLDDALAAFREAVRLRPDLADSHIGIGNVLRDQGRLDEAIASYRTAAEARPDSFEAHYDLGNALSEATRLDDAIAAYGEAIRLRADFPDAHNNLGIVLQLAGRLQEAVRAFEEAIRLREPYPEAWNNLARALDRCGRLDGAIAACRRAIALQPDLAEAHANLSLLLLLKGDYENGWAEYEWRWKSEEFRAVRQRFSGQRWEGDDPTGRTILIHTEQGFGDTIQFIRYAPLVAGRGARVIVECQAELKSLLRNLAAVDTVIAAGENLPSFDFHVPLLSLPRIFGTTVETIPAQIPYLKPDPDRVKSWRKRVGEGGLRVGLAWAGNPANRTDRDRSLPLAAFAPLGEVKGVRFFSLQKGAGSEQAKSPPPGLHLIDLTDQIKDFADTAALMANLDLIITVETAVAHLAGATGRPVWTMIPFVPAWRWFLDREDSPWYPTMRLFRQPSRGDWGSVIRRMAAELAHRRRS